MPDGQRIVGDEAFREHPLVTFPSLFGFREVVGEVCANQLSRGIPVTFTVASFTSVILPSGLIVTSGSTLASIRLRAYCVRRISSEMSFEINRKPIGLPVVSRRGVITTRAVNWSPFFR